jgi:hypothetical protein
MATRNAEITVKILDMPRFQWLVEALARVQQIHSRNEHYPHYCVTCRAPHPCRTIRALAGGTDGEVT